MKTVYNQVADEVEYQVVKQVKDQVRRQVMNQVYYQVDHQIHDNMKHELWSQIHNDAYQNNFDLLPERTFVPQALVNFDGYGNAVAYTKKTSTPSGNFLIPYISKLFQKMRGLLG